MSESPFQYTGDLAEEPLPEILRTIHHHRVPGVVTATSGDVVKKIYLMGGNVIFATSSDLHDSLGAYLKKSAIISSGELRVSTSRIDASHGKRHGELLVEMGVLTPDQLRQIVTEQVKAILYSVFSWEKGTVTFEVGKFRTEELIQLDVSTPQAIADGIRLLPDPRRVVSRLGPSWTIFERGEVAAGASGVSWSRRRAEAPFARGRAPQPPRPHHRRSRRRFDEREARLCFLGAASRDAPRRPDERNQEDPVEDGLRQHSRGRRRRRGLTDMPLYEFQCTKCGRKTEVIQSFSDPPPAKCPHCGGTLAKLLSSPAFQFKGSGFYSTDYGKSGGKPGGFFERRKREILRKGKREILRKGKRGRAAPRATPEPRRRAIRRGILRKRRRIPRIRRKRSGTPARLRLPTLRLRNFDRAYSPSKKNTKRK